MATLRDIKGRINAVSGTAKITQAMYMVSSAKLRRAQEAIWSARPYVQKLDEVLSNLVDSIGDDYENPLITQRKTIKNIAVIAIVADRGLCGSFNSNLMRNVSKYITEDFPEEYPNATAKLILVGKKAHSNLKVNNPFIIRKFEGIFQSLQFTVAKEIVDIAKTGFINGEFDKVLVFFNEFKNLLTQVPRKINLLPIEPKESVSQNSKFNIDYIFEPNKDQILDDLLPKSLDIQLWRTLLESNAAEQASRRMAMDNATKNANDLVKQLELQFNKERQAAITTEMLEIVGGANALKKE